MKKSLAENLGEIAEAVKAYCARAIEPLVARLEKVESYGERVARLEGRDQAIDKAIVLLGEAMEQKLRAAVAALPNPEKGASGDDGSDGLDGAPGAKGDKGDPGERGEKGETGAAGVKGDKGDPGERGEKGETGAAGVKGEKGDPGERGEKGEAGAAGVKGEKGDPGERGEKGLEGAAGAKGEKGDPGERGEKGLDGAPGAKGDKGDAGERGEKGLDGAAGAKGDKGDPGERGEKGETGAAGAKGDKGDPGERGEKGKRGLGVVKTLIDEAGVLHLTLSDGTVEKAGLVRGAAGRDATEDLIRTQIDASVDEAFARALREAPKPAAGKSVVKARVAADGELIFSMSDGEALSAGSLKRLIEDAVEAALARRDEIEL